MKCKILAAVVLAFFMIGILTPVYGEEKSGQQKEIREKRIKQLRKEAEKAERESQRLEKKVKRLERLEKPAKVTKKAADTAIEVAPKNLVGRGIEQIYKGTTKSILDPQGAEKRKRIIEERKRKMAEERRKKEEWAKEFSKKQEEFNKDLQNRLETK